MKAFRRHLKAASDLITTPENTRAGFIALALERNRRASPYVAEGRDLKVNSAQVNKPLLLPSITRIHAALLTAGGVSDKAARYFEEIDKNVAIENLITEFLEPVGDAFVEELVFRFLLTRGDTLGGSMRNVGGALAQRKLSRALMASLSNAGRPFRWLHGPTAAWAEIPTSGIAGLESELRGLAWTKGRQPRTLIFNLGVPVIKNNVDLCLLDCSAEEFQAGEFRNPARYLSFGELKGGIDPAGADEHWKTAATALRRIRDAFAEQGAIRASFLSARPSRRRWAMKSGPNWKMEGFRTRRTLPLRIRLHRCAVGYATCEMAPFTSSIDFCCCPKTL